MSLQLCFAFTCRKGHSNLVVTCLQLAQAIRIILKFKEVEFEDKYYPQGDPPGYCKKEWYDAKYNLGLDLPNVRFEYQAVTLRLYTIY